MPPVLPKKDATSSSEKASCQKNLFTSVSERYSFGPPLMTYICWRNIIVWPFAERADSNTKSHGLLFLWWQIWYDSLSGFQFCNTSTLALHCCYCPGLNKVDLLIDLLIDWLIDWFRNIESSLIYLHETNDYCGHPQPGQINCWCGISLLRLQRFWLWLYSNLPCWPSTHKKRKVFVLHTNHHWL